MMAKILILLFLPVYTVLASWPEEINEIRKSMCLVEFYQPQYEFREMKDDTRIKKTLSGILVNDAGLVMTSDAIFPASLDIVSRDRFYAHMQNPPEDISVTFNGEQQYKADLLGIDEEYRVAFIQIRKPDGLPDAVKFSEDDPGDIGDPLFLLQHLNEIYGKEVIITDHNINAVIKKPFKKILTTSSVPAISSGGVAVNADGEAVGIVFRGDQDMSGYPFDMDMDMGRSSITQILPATYLTGLISNPPKMQLQKNGTGKSWIGIRMQILTKEMAAYWGISETRGIIINSIVHDSPANKGGLQVGDIVTKIDGFTLQGDEEQDLESFRSYIRSLPEGPVTVEYIRENRKVTATIELENAPMSKFFAEEFSEEFLRFSVKELTQDIILENDLEFNTEGVWVSRVEEGGPAGLSGLMINDLILAIDDQPVKDLDGFKKITGVNGNKRPPYIKLFVKRDNKTLFIFVKTSFAMNRTPEE